MRNEQCVCIHQAQEKNEEGLIGVCSCDLTWEHTYIARHTAHTIVSMPIPKNVFLNSISNLILISTYIYIYFTITKREIGKLNTHSPAYYIRDSWENITEKILYVESLQVYTMIIMIQCNVYTKEHDHQFIMYPIRCIYMMTSSNGNLFRVTGPLCGEITCHRWIPHTKASDA